MIANIIVFLLIISLVIIHFMLKNKEQNEIENIKDGIDELFRFKMVWLKILEKRNIQLTSLFLLILFFFLVLIGNLFYLEITSYLAVFFGVVSTLLIFNYITNLATMLQKQITKNFLINTNNYYMNLISKALLFSIFLFSLWLVSHKLFFLLIQMGLDIELLQMEKNKSLFFSYFNENYVNAANSEAFFTKYYYLKTKIFYLLGIIFTSFFTIISELIYAKSATTSNQILSQIKFHIEEDNLVNPTSIFNFASNTISKIKITSILVIISCFTLSNLHENIGKHINLHFETAINFNAQHFHLTLLFTPVIILTCLYLLFRNKITSENILKISTLTLFFVINIIVYSSYLIGLMSLKGFIVIGLGTLQCTLILLLTQKQLNLSSKIVTKTESDFDNNILSGLISGMTHSLIPTLLYLSITIIGFLISFNLFKTETYFLHGLFGVILNCVGFLPFIVFSLICYIIKCFEKTAKSTLNLLEITISEEFINSSTFYTSKFFLNNNFLIINFLASLGFICLFIYKIGKTLFNLKFFKIKNISEIHLNIIDYSSYANKTISEIAYMLKISIFSEEFLFGLISGLSIVIIVTMLSLLICKNTINTIMNGAQSALNQINEKENTTLDFSALFLNTIKQTNKHLYIFLILIILSPILMLSLLGSSGTIGTIIGCSISVLVLGILFSNMGILWEKYKILAFDKEKDDIKKTNAIIGTSLSEILGDTLIPILLIFSFMLYIILFEGTIIAVLSDYLIWHK
tara:strand:+ start:5182 stop:7425 length:2244 start_codon:yes stop_codon:yes gene_type:complete